MDFLHARYCRSLRFRWCSLHTSLPGFHPSGNPPLGLLAFTRFGIPFRIFILKILHSNNLAHMGRFVSLQPRTKSALGLLAFGRSNVRPHMGTGFGFASRGVPAQNPLYSVKVLVCSCVYSDFVSVRDKERYVYNSTCLKCSRFCTALSSIAFF